MWRKEYIYNVHTPKNANFIKPDSFKIYIKNHFDGRRPKHVGPSQSDFNVNFNTLSSLIKSAFVGVWTL